MRSHAGAREARRLSLGEGEGLGYFPQGRPAGVAERDGRDHEADIHRLARAAKGKFQRQVESEQQDQHNRDNNPANAQGFGHGAFPSSTLVEHGATC